MPYRLAPGISACRVGEQVVCLDQRADRYFAITGDGAEALIALATTPELPNISLLDRLVERGLLVHASQARFDFFEWPRAEASVLEQADLTRAARPIDLMRVSAALAITSVRQKVFNFDRILRRRREALSANKTKALAQLKTIGDLSRRFMASRRLVPIGSSCLLDSLALIDFLGEEGRHVDLVFGVDLAPFSAHCWLQVGPCALNESAHRTTAFTPILAI